MHNDSHLLDTIEPDIADRFVSRRDALRKGATVSSTLAAGLALGSVPVALAAFSREAFGQSTPTTVQAVLDFALMLEIFENEFYKAVLGTSANTGVNNAFATVRAAAAGVPGAVPALQQIQKHEAAHVAFLLANGAHNTLNLAVTSSSSSFDFTGGRGSGTGPFARATTELPFLLLVAQAAEDTGVRAYKGQAANLMSNAVVLEAALRIHSVEARHAAKIRRVRRAAGAPGVVKYSGTVSGTGAAAAGAGNISNPPADAVAALNLIYANESASSTILALPNLPVGIDAAAAVSEAFDEPLTRDQVKAIVQGFFVPTIP